MKMPNILLETVGKGGFYYMDIEDFTKASDLERIFIYLGPLSPAYHENILK